jgi:hypothetical protein
MRPEEIFYVVPAANGRVWRVIEALTKKISLFPNRLAALLYARRTAMVRGSGEIITMNLKGETSPRQRVL